MSITLMSRAFETALAPSHKITLLALCDYSDDKGENIWPSIPTIARRATLSERQAQRVVHELERQGWIVVVGNALGGAGRSRRYRINVAFLVEQAAAAVRAAAMADQNERGSEEGVGEQVTAPGEHGGDILAPLGDRQMGDNPSPFGNEEKGDNLTPLDVKSGDNLTSLPGERVTPTAQRVTPTTQKGDAHVTRSTINPSIEPRDTPNKKTDDKNLPSSGSGSGDAIQPDEVTKAFEFWNGICPPLGLVVAERLSRGRRELIAERLAEVGGIVGWRRVIQRIARSAFLCGENKKGWKADIDFVLDERHFLKLSEGGFDDREAPSPGDDGPEASSIRPDLLAKLRRGGLFTPNDIRRWIEPCTLTEQAIAAPTKFMADYIENKFGNWLRRAFGDAFEIIVAPQPATMNAALPDLRRTGA